MYVTKKFTTKFYEQPTGSSHHSELLWGDSLRPTGRSENGRVQVRARGSRGWVRESHVADDEAHSLLELYFIDVGQGDGVLIRTPDGRHILIDGGYNRASQPTGKNAADFVDWKFYKDYGKRRIELDAMISSHCDADHYGGLWDLLNVAEAHELDCSEVRVDALYHAGPAWQTYEGRSLGRIDDGWLIDLPTDRDSISRGVAGQGQIKLQGNWRKFMREAVAHVPVIERLSHEDVWVPGFDPEGATATLKVLAPVLYDLEGRAALRDLGSDSQNTNGHSLCLRLDYGGARILLTGDLNKASQQLLAKEWAGQMDEFSCDVAKGCHHGSDDVSWSFTQAMGATATVISSGDAEGHAHPRPTIVAAAGAAGHQTVDTAADELKTPLVYSTEIARSLDIGRVTQVKQDGTTLEADDGGTVEASRVRAGNLRGKKVTRALRGSHVVTGIVYGLINVRTDGQTIMCANLNETKMTWEVESFPARF